MPRTVFTGWKTITPGECMICGLDSDWECDGRGNILCTCQACPECGIIDAYGFHDTDCKILEEVEVIK